MAGQRDDALHSARSFMAVPSAVPVDLRAFSRAELGAWCAERGWADVHARRLWRAMYQELQTEIGQMNDLPPRIRTELMQVAAIPALDVVRSTASSDGYTRKFLLGLADGRAIETVRMRYTGRVTACLSSQVGCAMGCVFCATGQQGFTRHLRPEEMVAQALHVQRDLQAEHPAHRLRNVVFMGMGEPLHNYEAVMQAIDILRDPGGLALAADRIAISTVGVIPGILRLAEEARPVQLAVSLHAATQSARMALVPTARRWPLEDLMAACRTYIEKTGRRIFYEWTLIQGQNDASEAAHAVGRLLQGQYAQVNLIPLNPTEGYAGAPSDLTAARAFQSILAEYGLPSTVRQRRGIDIDAGCGQLADRG